MAFPNVTDILTTTIEARGKKLRDNISDSNAVLTKLKQKGNIKPFSGGHLIREEFEFAENGNANWYSGAEQLSVSAQDVISAAEFGIKQLACAVVINGLEKLQNAGPNGLIDLLEARVKNGEKTMKNRLAEGVHSDGTGSGGKIITGLGAAVPTSPSTGTYGGIDRSNALNAFFRSQLKTNTATAAGIQADMTDLFIACTRGTDKPDLILSGNNLFKTYLASLQAIQRITDPKMAEAGFTSVKFMSADVVLDGGIGGNMDTNQMVFVNTDYIYLRPHSERDMVPLKPGSQSPYNQDVEAVILAWAGNMTASGPQFCGRYLGA